MLNQQAKRGTIGLRKTTAWNDFENLVDSIKFELQCLEDNIFHAAMKELKKYLSKLIIPAIIEAQSLPGFTTSEGSRIYQRMSFNSNSNNNLSPTQMMDKVLQLLNKIWRAMKCYGIEASVTNQILTELLKFIGVTTFNDLLMRKNFSSWKRAMQIQYNITRIEEWCKSHQFSDGMIQLEHVLQAAKLLQMKKVIIILIINKMRIEFLFI